MEMSDVSAAEGVPAEIKLEDPAESEAEPWPSKRDKPRRCCQALLIAGLVTLPLLLFLVLGQESAATAWQIATAKLTAMNGGRGSSEDAYDDDGAVTGATAAANADELFGGLLAPGMDRRSCRSRYDSWRYYKRFPYAPSPHLLRRLRDYEARHRRCAPGTPLYAKAVEQLRSGRSADNDTVECNYVVWLPFDGLGNRMLSMVSGFLYALLTDRVFLAALPPDSDDLFCEPFPGTTWRLPADDFGHVAKLFGVGQNPDRSYSSLLDKKEIAVPENPAAANATAPPVPAYVYLSLGWLLTDRIFFCGEHQLAIKKVNWLLQYSDLYFAPSLYAVAEFQDELRQMFPAKESVSHLLTRYLLHPTNSVWGIVTRYYRSNLARADRRIGVQIRMYGHSSIPADDMYNQILACSRQESILPAAETDGGDGSDSNNGTTTTTAILIASLYADYYKRLRSRYAARGGAVGVFQPTHEERQATESLVHNRKALAEIYLLSFSEELITSGLSTFGYVAASLAGVRPAILMTAFDHKVPATPCRRAVSMEPCNLTPPRDVECRGKAVDDKEDLARHVRVCEDWENGVKFFD